MSKKELSIEFLPLSQNKVFLLNQFDKQKLVNWYADACHKHANNANFIINFTKVIVVLQTSFSLIVFLVYPIQLALLGLVSNLIVVTNYLYHYYTKLEPVSENSFVLNLNPNQFPKIWSTCYKLIESMGLGIYSFKIVYVKTNTFQVHIGIDNDEITLFLTRRIISFSEAFPLEFESILAHEFGHIYQGDNKLLSINKSAFTLPGIYNLGILILIIVRVLVFDVSVGINVLISFFIPCLTIMSFFKLMSKRKSAENLADMASVIFAENSKIEDVIANFLPQSNSFWYPRKNQRLNYIRKIIKNISS